MEREKILHDAANDLQYLLNRGYNKKSALKLVGDRYILDKNERHILFRAIFSENEIKNRDKKKLSQDQLKDRILSIDGYNVLITLETMLNNKILINAADSFFRDASKISKRYKKSKKTDLAIKLMFEKLVKLAPKYIYIFFDKPISKSGEFSALINEKISEFKLKGIAKAVNSPDHEIIKQGETVISADSLLLDKGKTIFDLAGSIIKEQAYQKIISFM
ncbi:MAG: DUF434 domain-containing protein [Candidatus Helarchaeota archaeon]|nr:DUF434 domain-containing protein [Candidatus Helarchaeota archaeon]